MFGTGGCVASCSGFLVTSLRRPSLFAMEPWRRVGCLLSPPRLRQCGLPHRGPPAGAQAVLPEARGSHLVWVCPARSPGSS